NKGGFVFSMLGRQIGVDRFRQAFHEITSRHAHGQVSWEEFLRTIERASGQDLTQFFAQWFERSGAPDFALSWRQDVDRIAALGRRSRMTGLWHLVDPPFPFPDSAYRVA